MNSDEVRGLPKYLYNGQDERVEELNDRIYDRNYITQPLEVNYTPRSVPTKYAHFSIVEKKHPISTIKPQYLPTYSVEKQFVPGRGPVSGYFANINTENSLRNQNFALQRDGKSTYIPSSNSDLYKNYIISRPSHQPFPRLFEKYTFESTPSPLENTAVGANLFFNDTRAQLRGDGE